MVRMARNKANVKEETVVNRPIVEDVEVERPVSTRAKWNIDQNVLNVIATADQMDRSGLGDLLDLLEDFMRLRWPVVNEVMTQRDQG
jgi:hypothetical protein